MNESWKLWTGQVVNGQFHLRQYLGGSDHSAVFLTEHGEGKFQKAAIKLISADTGNAEHQLSQWALAGKLSHPHLLPVFQSGRCQLDEVALLYVVMECADEDLSQILPERALTASEASAMLGPTLDALGYLHNKSFLHGRVKPANIMAMGDQLKLSADSICRVGESSRNQRKLGVYDPPEAASGGLSPAGDIWSLGMTLVEVLTQRLPVWERMGQSEPMLPDTVPAPFREIARNCLRRDPERRWTVAGISARLNPAPSLPAKEPAPTPQKVSAKPRFIVPAVAVGVALALLLIVPKLFHHGPDVGPSSSSASEQTPSSKPDQVPVDTPAQPIVPPEPAPTRVVPAAAQPAKKVSAKKQISAAVTPSAPPVRSDAGMKAPAAVKVRGEVVHQVLPEASQKALDTIHGTVRVSVRVSVDPSGKVADASFDSPGPSKYFADLALQAARNWTFSPAMVDGQNVPSEWVLRFEYGRTETKVLPRQQRP
ncbi:MAG: TonB family protein [Candidatus Acidiferrales bacterium]